MASAERFGVYPASFVHAGGTLDLTQMESFRVTPQASKAEIIPAGSVDRAAVVTANSDARAQFGTKDLNTYFGTVSATAGLVLTGNATFRLQEREEAAAFLTGATHGTVVATGGWIIPESLSASIEDNDGAVLRSIFQAFWDGTNAPFVFNDAVNFAAAPTPAFNSLFFLGPVYHNSVEISGITNVSVNFGIQFNAAPKSPGPHKETGAIMRRTPEITFTTAKTDEGAGLDMFHRAVNTSFAVYFWKGANNSDRVAKATAEHCKISFTAGDIETTEVGGDGTEDAMLQTTVRPTGTIAVSVASAIP